LSSKRETGQSGGREYTPGIFDWFGELWV